MRRRYSQQKKAVLEHGEEQGRSQDRISGRASSSLLVGCAGIFAVHAEEVRAARSATPSLELDSRIELCEVGLKGERTSGEPWTFVKTRL